MNKHIRIGTRDSQLALWQATTVKKALENLGYTTTLVPIKCDGDIILDKPLYELGITGVFTKTLDIAMLNGQIDIAVHSMKDVPTLLPKGIVQGAVLPRATTEDVLVFTKKPDFTTVCTVATSSLRRKAQWLHKYPKHKVVDLRGNVNTRLQKLEDNAWTGAIFAKAGLERIQLLPKNHLSLDWMLPAPAQGAMMVVAMESDAFCRGALEKINDKETEICTTIERDFLRTLEGGCTAPIAALATIDVDYIHFKGELLLPNGSKKVAIEKSVLIENHEGLGIICANEVLGNGGATIMKKINAKK